MARQDESDTGRLGLEAGVKVCLARHQAIASDGAGCLEKLATAAAGRGDAGDWLIVGADDAPRPQATDKTERKRRARVKYAFYAGKPLQRRGQKRGSRAAKKVEASAKADTGGDEAGPSE